MVSSIKSLTSRYLSNFKPIWNIYMYCFNEEKIGLSISIILILFAGILESIGILIIIPLIEILTGKDPNELHFISKSLFDIFNFLNIPINIFFIFIPFLLLIIIKSIGIILSQNYVNRIVYKLTQRNRIKFIQAVANAEWRFFPKKQTGLLSSVLNLETQGIALSSKYLVTFLSGLIRSLIFIITAFLISVVFSLGALFAGIMLFIILNSILKLTRESSIRKRDLIRKNSILSTDFINNIKAFKAMNLEKKITNRMVETVKKLKKTEILLDNTQNFIKGVQEPIGLFFLSVLIIISFTFYNMELGIIVVSIALFYRVFGQVAGIQSAFIAIVRSEAQIKGVELALNELNNYKEEFNKHTISTKFNKKITVSNLSFSYKDKKILNNINCEIESGKITALIGPSGSGKTSFVDLIIGLQKANSGNIFIDDQDIKNINIKEWRNSIGYVPQTFTLLFDTVRYNLTLGDKSISDSHLDNALELSGAMEFVNEFPNKIDESIGQAGLKISGGQMQRLALARALVRKPQLLILDEATSALDPVTEKSLCQTFSNLKNQISILAISHRDAIENISDVIYYFNQGEIEKK